MTRFLKKLFACLLAVPALFFAETSHAQTYCTPTYTTGCSQGDYISNFTLGSYSRSSGCGAGNYSLSTGPVFYQNREYPFSITIGSVYNQHVAMWVDYNDDGGFYETEFEWTSATPGTSFSGIFRPYASSLGVTGGWTRMRLRTEFFTEGPWVENRGITFNNEACQPRNYGETEDYEFFFCAYPGTIAADTQTICNGGNPSNIVFSATDNLGETFQWYYKNGIVSAPNVYDPTGSWISIPGATANNYDPPAGLTTTRTYACRVTLWGPGIHGTPYVWVEGARYVKVLPLFNPGSIVSGDEVFCNTGNPAPINLGINPVGSGAYQWRWYWRENATGACPSGSSTSGWATNSTSLNVTGTTTTGAGITFDPGSAGTAGAGRTFSVLITPLANGSIPACGAPSFALTCRRTTVNICSSFSPGTLSSGDQTLCYKGDPAIITFSVSPTAGSTYQWYYVNGTVAAPANTAPTTGWTLIAGATASSYDPPALLTVSRTYACRVFGGGTNQWATGVRQVTVLPLFNSGTIASGDQSLCSNGNPAPIYISVAASGSGGYIYQWYYKNAVVTCPTGNVTTGWTAVSGGTGASYDPLSANTTGRTFARLVTPAGTPTCGAASFSNSCRKVTVIAPPCASSRRAVDDLAEGEEPLETLDGTPVLFQNVPNPFSMATTIPCFLPEATQSAALRVYGLDGRMLQELPISGKGRQELTVEKSRLSPGLYLYTLVVNGQPVAVKKLSVSK